MKDNNRINFLGVWVFCVIVLFGICIVGGVSSKSTLAATNTSGDVTMDVQIKNITNYDFDVYVELTL